MEFDPEALTEELRSLRKGRATLHPSLRTRLGPQLRSLCDVDAHDVSTTVIRAKLAKTIRRLLRGQPEALVTALLAALALHPQANQKTLAGRQIWLTQQLHYQERTARRRIDEAIELLVQAAIDDRHGPPEIGPSVDAEAHPDAWRVRRLDALLTLDTESPEVTERRSIVVTADVLDEIACRISVPRYGGEDHEVSAEVVFGGQFRASERPSDDHFVFYLDLPRRLRAGEEHEYGLRFKLPRGQMAPHYVLLPFITHEAFDLTVRFDVAKPPRLVWRLDGVAPREVDSPRPRDHQLTVDRFGQLRVSFRQLRLGRAYGIAWLAD
jgi:hypothetical protein